MDQPIIILNTEMVFAPR